MSGVGYRVRQFCWALRADQALDTDARYDGWQSLLDSRLSAAQRRLFVTMDLADQRHCLDVYRLLTEGGHDDEDLLQAALLHDVGKGLTRVRLWHRVAVVIVNAIHRGICDRLQCDKQGSWRYPFFVHRHHAELGARLIEAAGSRPRVVDLVRRHDTGGDDGALEALRRADQEC